MFKKTDLIYLAGFFDGEGCLIYTKGRGIRCELVNTDKNVMKWVYKTFGGKLKICPKDGTRKIVYRLGFRHNELRILLPHLIQYLRVKKKSAKEVLKYLHLPSLKVIKGTKCPPFSKEWKRKMSESKLRYNPGAFKKGRIVSKEIGEKISKSLSRRNSRNPT